MKYIVYQTINTVNNKIYIGVHGTEDPETFDGYIGNGIDIYRPATYLNPKTPFQCAVKKYGVKNFHRSTIAIFDNEKEAYKLEESLVNEEFVRREDVYNLALGGRINVINSFPKKEVHMYDLDGNYIRSFEGVNQAARYVDPNCVTAGHLPRAIKEGHQFHGFQFSYEKLPFMKKLKHRNMGIVEKPYSGRKVARMDENNNILEVYETMTDCVKAGYKNAKLVAQGKRNSCKGYKFKYLD